MADRFPNDPLLRLLPAELPTAFLALPPEEQRWRGKYFLAVWAADFPEGYSWAHALQTGEVAPEAKALVESIPDEQIEEQVKLRIQHYAALAAEATAAQRAGA